MRMEWINYVIYCPDQLYEKRTLITFRFNVQWAFYDSTSVCWLFGVLKIVIPVNADPQFPDLVREKMSLIL